MKLQILKRKIFLDLLKTQLKLILKRNHIFFVHFMKESQHFSCFTLFGKASHIKKLEVKKTKKVSQIKTKLLL